MYVGDNKKFICVLPEQPEGSEHGEAGDPLGQELYQGQHHDQEVKAVPTVLRQVKTGVVNIHWLKW